MPAGLRTGDIPVPVVVVERQGISPGCGALTKMRREPFKTDEAQREASAAVRARIALSADAAVGSIEPGGGSRQARRGRGADGRRGTVDRHRAVETPPVGAQSRDGASGGTAVADLALSECVEAVHVAEALGHQCAALDAPCGTR